MIITMFKWNFIHEIKQFSYPQNRNRFTDLQNELKVIRGKHVERKDWQCGINMYTLLRLKQATNKDL